MELECREPSCPPLETVIAAMEEGKPTRQWKFHKPMPEVTQSTSLKGQRKSLTPVREKKLNSYLQLKEFKMSTAESTVPVTVLTGFLGSGKTTLLNRILSENHGKRIAVIENEFGEIGVDNDLVLGAEEEIFEMNNGCICCTVRGDLIRILGNLMKRRDKFDHIMIETTGMADPGPVAQTFFMDDEMRESLNLDGVVTLVDAKHVLLHIDDSDEVKEQIAFADVILLNKTDLVTPEALDQLEARIHSMNPAARIFRTQNSVVDMNNVLDIGGFDLDRALEVDPKFMEPEYPFEWSGLFEFQQGDYRIVLKRGPDPAMAMNFRFAAESTESPCVTS